MNHKNAKTELGRYLAILSSRLVNKSYISFNVSLQTLDLLQKLCENRGYGFLRLDGKTPTSKRQSLVDRFNDKYCKICKCCILKSSIQQ